MTPGQNTLYKILNEKGHFFLRKWEQATDTGSWYRKAGEVNRRRPGWQKEKQRGGMGSIGIYNLEKRSCKSASCAPNLYKQQAGIQTNLARVMNMAQHSFPYLVCENISVCVCSSRDACLWACCMCLRYGKLRDGDISWHDVVMSR